MTYAKIQDIINKYNAGLISDTEYNVIKIFQELDKQLVGLLTDVYRRYDLPIMTNGVPDGNATMAFMRARVIPAEGGKLTRLAALENQVRDILGPSLVKKDKMMESMTRFAYQNGYYLNAYGLEKISGLNLDFRLLNDTAITAATTNQFSKFSARRLGEIDSLKVDRAVTISKLNKAIEMGLGRGDNLITIAKRVDQIMGFRGPDGKFLEGKINKRGVTYDSMRIVRTEMMRAYSLGQNEFFTEVKDQLKEEGLEPRLKWISTLDARTRADHADMDGELSNEDGEFTLPDGTVGIQHNFGIPEQDINCRCANYQVIDGLEPIVRRSRDEGIIPMQDFEEWAKSNGLEKSIYGEDYSFNG
jgi:hypothetical protein